MHLNSLTAPILVSVLPTGIDTTTIEQIGNLGIMLVISSVVVFFIVKVLSSLLEQNKLTVSSILPKVNELEDILHSTKRDIVDSISSHNMSANKQFFEASNKIDAVYKSNVDIEDKFDEIVKSLNALTVQMEVIQQFIAHAALDDTDDPEKKK